MRIEDKKLGYRQKRLKNKIIKGVDFLFSKP